MTLDYKPELDISAELDGQEAAYYQSLIGTLRWIVELGRVDIYTEASLMASCMALPRMGHLDQLFRMFSCLKHHHNTEMVFDPSDPDIDESQFPADDWTHTLYYESKRPVPRNRPEERGFGFKIRAFVDSDHAGNDITRRSCTGFTVFLNSAPIFWYSKKQTSVQTSSFGSAFVALKECCEYLRGLTYKL